MNGPREDVADPTQWTEVLSDAEISEIDAAIAFARAQSSDFLDIGKERFPLPTLAARLKRIEHDLIEGRGFVLIRGLPRERYTNDEMCLAYWGIGAHLGKPWPQNHHGHVLGDVTDQGKGIADPTARGNELGQIGLEYHCDGSDLVGLLCLQRRRRAGCPRSRTRSRCTTSSCARGPSWPKSCTSRSRTTTAASRSRASAAGTSCRCSRAGAIGCSCG